ncbi:MAG: DUF4838 domain-containing protein, partial [Phycisphaerae bacterium]
MTIGKSWKAIVGMLCVAVFASCHGSNKQPVATWKLAENGSAAAVIVLKKDTATEAETFAAEELKSHLRRMTGADFKIVDEKSAGESEKKIFVGQSAFALANGVDYAHLAPEEWILKTVGNNLILSGGRPRGTLYAVYEFLEKHGGCAWLDSRTEVVPQRKTFAIPELNENAKPEFFGREVYTEYKTGGNDFLIRNKINSQAWGNSKYGYQAAGYGSPGVCHTMYAYAKDWPRQYPDHPEYFALTEKGERLKPTSAANDGMLICLTNPEVRKLVLQKLRAYIAKDRADAAAKGCPPPTIYSISQDDNPGYCVCPKCKTILEREGAYSGVMLDFINDIAREIKKEYPDIYIHAFAYTFTLEPPKSIKAEKNVIVQLCNLGSEWYPITSAEHLRSVLHEDNKPFQEVLKSWAKVAGHLAIWDYWSMYKDVQVPYCNVSFIQPDLKFYRDNKVDLLFLQEGDISKESFQALKEWLGYKMMQNPDRPAAGFIKTFMAGYYGAAAARVTEYLNYLEMRIAQTPGLYGRLKVRDWTYLDLPFFVKANALLDQAEASVADNPLYSLNVRRERIPVDCALLYLWDRLSSKMTGGAKMPFDRQRIIARYEKNRADILKEIYKAQKKQADVELEKLACEIKLLKNPPALPEQFQGKEIVDFLWPDFTRKSIDPDAAGGMAFRLDEKATPDGMPDHSKPLAIGVYDVTNKKAGPSLTIKKEDVPQDGKYHLYT